jgi:hypothetical protein
MMLVCARPQQLTVRKIVKSLPKGLAFFGKTPGGNKYRNNPKY